MAQCRLMRKPIGDGLEMLFFFVDAVPAPPVPRLVHERSVRGIHQPDNSLVDVGGHVAS